MKTTEASIVWEKLISLYNSKENLLQFLIQIEYDNFYIEKKICEEAKNGFELYLI